MSSSDMITLELPLLVDVQIDEAAQVRTRLIKDGIEFHTLAEEQPARADWLELFCELDNVTRMGTWSPPRTVEQMRKRIIRMGILPERVFIAVHGSRYVGYTYLAADDSDPAVMKQCWTGIRPEYQRRGIATALKLLAIAFAREYGSVLMVTQVRTDNSSSLSMNLKLGFRVCNEK